MNVVVATPSTVESSGAPQVIRIEIEGVATRDEAPQLRNAIARAIQFRFAEDDDDDDENEDDDDEDDRDDEEDSIAQLRGQVELLRDEVHELHELVERVISRK
jgi:hypothetical protein